MGKSLNGKELGKGITQRKSDGLYQGRFINRFGKTQTIYADLLQKNVAEQVNTVITMEGKKAM